LEDREARRKAGAVKAYNRIKRQQSKRTL